MKSMFSIQSLISLAIKPNLGTNFLSQTAWTILRVVIGLAMVHNGLDKLGNIEGFAKAYVEYIGLPFPVLLSYVAAYTELIGGPLLAIGLFARPAASGLFFAMCVAMYHHIKLGGFGIAGYELALLYAVSYLFFLINGAGLFSIDSLISGWLDSQASGLEEEDEEEEEEVAYQTTR